MPLFAGAVPYGPDIKKLEARFPVETLEEGMLIEHEILEAVINQKRGTSRYYGVVNSWRLRIRNQTAVFITWEMGKGLVVLPPHGVQGHAEAKTRQKIRQTARAIALFKWVDRSRLNDIGQRRFDHQTRLLELMRQQMETTKRQIAIELVPVRSLPKPDLFAG